MQVWCFFVSSDNPWQFQQMAQQQLAVTWEVENTMQRFFKSAKHSLYYGGNFFFPDKSDSGANLWTVKRLSKGSCPFGEICRVQSLTANKETWFYFYLGPDETKAKYHTLVDRALFMWFSSQLEMPRNKASDPSSRELLWADSYNFATKESCAFFSCLCDWTQQRSELCARSNYLLQSRNVSSFLRAEIQDNESMLHGLIQWHSHVKHQRSKIIPLHA